MKRKMRRLLAMLLAFTLTFTVASTDVLAAGLEMAGEESVISAPVAGTVEIVEDAVEAGEAGSVVADDAADAGEVDDAYVKEGVGAADAGEAGGVEAADAGEADGVDAEDGADAADADQAGGADAEDGADAVDADQADGADAEDGADADGVEAADADQADGANAEDGVDTADAGEAEGAEEAGGVDAADAGEAEGGEAVDGSDTMTESGSSPRLRSFGAPKSLSLSSTGFSEGFEGDGIPEGWTVETDTEGYEWSIVANDYHSGSKSAKRGFANGNGQTTWLITPAFDFSGVTGILKLSFWYRNSPWNGLFEELSVCWRVDGGEWQELSKTESGHADWTKQVLYLPENAKKANVEISFKCVNHDAYGLYLDDVLLETASEIPMYTVTYYANGGTGTVTDLGSPYGEESTVTVLPNGFTTPPEKYFLSWNTEADGSGTKYEPGDSFVITGDVTLYAKWAQQLTNGLEEGFDGTAGIPEGWRQEKSDVGDGWIISTSVKHSGSGAAYSSYMSGDGQTAWLIMPMFDLRNVTGVPRLSFWYGNSPDQDGRFDDLGVCWRVNGGEWQELFMTESAHADWTKQVLALPADVKTANLEIAFKSVNHYGNGVCVDDVSLEFVSSEWFQVTYQANGGTGTMTDESNPYLIGQVVTVLPNGFTEPAHKFFTGWNTKADGSGTTYYPGNDFEIAGNVTLYAQWADRSSGLNESFEATGLPGGWTVIADNEENQWFTGKDRNYGIASPFGKQMAIINSFNTNRDGTSWLISPAMDLSGAGNNWILSFWYCNPSYNDAWFDFETYYRVNGGEWKKLFQAGEGHGDWTEKQILLPEEAKAANVEIGFKAMEAYSYGVYLDGVVLRKVNGSVYTISTSDEISGGSVKTDLNLAGAGETVTLTVKPNYLYTLQTLTVKKGSVSVATTKVDETTYTFVMPEGNVTVEATFQPLEGMAFYEDFEDADLPGWTFVDADGDDLGWHVQSFTDKQDKQGNDFTVSGDQFFTSASYANYEALTPDNWAITPAIQVPDNATLSFWIKGVDPDFADEIMAVYVGTGANVESMTKVGGDYTAVPAYKQYFVDLSAFAGQIIYIGFRHYNVTDMFQIALEDVLVAGDEGNGPFSVSYDANGGSGETVDLSSPYQKNDTATVMPNLFTAPEGKMFDSWNTKADGSGATYHPAETITVRQAVKLYAQWKTIPTMPARLEEGFEGGVIPSGWKIEGDENYQWTVGTGDQKTETGAHSGEKNALIKHQSKGSIAWLVTPAMNLSHSKDAVLKFWYVNRKWGSDIDEFTVCYRVDKGEWNALFHTSDAHGEWTEQVIILPEEARAVNVEFGFKALDKWGYGIGLDDVDVRAYEEPVYLVTTGNPENGTITANKEGIHKKGDIVVLTVTPDNGYKLAEILLTTYGEYPKIFKRGGNEYGFLVTDDDVTVSASFVPNSETVTYELWVGGTQVSESNAGNILGNGAASYDAITKTLTLNMDVENNDVSGEYKDAITSYVDGLAIKTTRSLKLSSAGDDAMELNGFTTIETNGLLTLEGATSKGGYGIFAQAPMVIRNSRIAASGRWGIRNEGDGMIRVLNSAITVQGTEGAMGPIELEGCQVLSPANGEMGEDGYVLVPNGSLFSYPREMEIGRVISVTADTPFAEDFEDGKTLEDWKFVEADDDGELWHQYSNQSGNVARSGIGTLTSASYSNRALTPDNWAFTPALKLPEHAVLSFWIAAQNPSWPNERMAVYVSSDRNPESATMLGGEYLATKDYAEYVIDLSAYAGQTVFLAFRHFNTYDQYRLNLDDVTVRVDESALTDNNLTIAKKSLTLQDTIAIDFKVAKSAIEGKYQDPYLVVTQNGEESIITKWEPNDDGTLMIFSYRVAPHNMRDVVTAVPHALNANGEDVTGVSVDYSVTDYCYNMLGKDTYQTDAWAPFRRLLVDILLYGDAAQKFTGYKTTELPSWKLTSAQRAMGTDVTVPMVYNNVKDVNFETVNASDEKAKIVTAALYLEASVNIQFKFTADDLTGLKVVVTDGENVLETLTPDPSKKDSNGRYYVTFGKLNAGQMRKTVYATVMQGTKKVSNTMQYSIESYAAAQSNSTVPNLPELLHAMMRYGDSAKAFVGAK